MNNKEYKAIVKKAAKRFERLQELELKDSNGIKNRVNWFIAEYISKNQLKEFSEKNCFLILRLKFICLEATRKFQL